MGNIRYIDVEKKLREQLINKYNIDKNTTLSKIITSILYSSENDESVSKTISSVSKTISIDLLNLPSQKSKISIQDRTNFIESDNIFCIKITCGKGEVYTCKKSINSAPDFFKRIMTNGDKTAFSYIILILSYLMGENITMLEPFNIKTYNSFCDVIKEIKAGENCDKIDALVKCINSAINDPTSSRQYDDLIPSDASIADLKELGWNIEADNSGEECYDKNKTIKKEPLNKKCSAYKLNEYIKKKQNLEYDFFFRYRNDEDSLTIRKLTTQIVVKKGSYTTNTADPKKDNITLPEFELKILPLFDALKDKLDEKIQSFFEKNYREYNAFEFKLFLGRVAKESRNNSRTFDLSDIDEEKIQDAKEIGLIEVLDDRKEVKFLEKYFQILLDGFAQGRDLNKRYFNAAPEDKEKIIKGIIEDIISYKNALDQENHDHRSFNLTEGCIFSVALISSVGSIHLRDRLIEQMCVFAEDYTVSMRLRQHLTVLILSYMLSVFHSDLTFALQKKVYRVCFDKQLYPAQIPIFASLQSNKFYSTFAENCFDKSMKKVNVLVEGKSRYFMSGQPWFPFVQPILRKPRRPKDYFTRALECEKQGWSSPEKYKPRSFCNLLRSMRELKWEDYTVAGDNDETALTTVVASQLALYAFSDIDNRIANREQGKQTKSTELYKALALNNEEEYRDYDQMLVKQIIMSDFAQRYYNPAYTCLLMIYKSKSKDQIMSALKFLNTVNGDFDYSISDSLSDADFKRESLNLVRRHMLLICGSFRCINAFSFTTKEKIILEDWQIKQYREWLDMEKEIKPRFHFMIVRMLSYTNYFDSEGNSTYDILDESCATLYEESGLFLLYDNFPKKYDDFVSEIEDRSSKLI